MITDVREALETLIEDTWSDVTVIFNVEDATKANWQYLITQHQSGASGQKLQPPWAVLQPNPAKTADYGATNESYLQSWTIWYVTALQHDNRTAKYTQEYLAEIEGVVASLAAALRSYSGTTFTVVTDPVFDNSDGNAANKYFIGGNHAFRAANVVVELVYGRTNE